MNMLANLTTDENIANERDSVGGGLVDSAIHKGKIEYAYLKKSDGGALALELRVKTPTGMIRTTQWMTSGTAKGCKNYYEKDGVKNYLPGFNMANAVSLLTLGKEISTLETEEKVINLYNSEAKAEVPTKVQMLVELLGQEIALGVLRQTVDKTKLVEGSNPPVYEPTGETREENEVDKIFRAKDMMTTAEIRAGAEEAKFHQTWAEKWAGKTRDKSTKGAGGNTGTAGAPGKTAAPGAGAGKKPTTSLFGG